jgi:hypothetical protein
MQPLQCVQPGDIVLSVDGMPIVGQTPAMVQVRNKCMCVCMHAFVCVSVDLVVFVYTLGPEMQFCTFYIVIRLLWALDHACLRRTRYRFSLTLCLCVCVCV